MLDLSNNKIFSIESIEVLHKLENLAEINFKENPVCVHKHLVSMVLDVVPNIEVVNSESLKEAGTRYKDELQKLRNKIEGLGDRNILEAAEDDHEFRIKLLETDEKGTPSKSGKRIDDMFHLVKKDEEKAEKMFNEIEKNFGLRVK